MNIAGSLTLPAQEDVDEKERRVNYLLLYSYGFGRL
jgi:hypothetical protein